MTKWLIKRLLMAMAVMLALGLIGGGALLALLHHYGQQLPDYRQLANYEPPTVTRLHAGDGQLLAEYATEKRIFVPIEAIPRRVVEAFLAAEDKNFYSHSGVDWIAVSRAAMQNVLHLGADRRPVGASTITQQVAKTFLLNNEPSMARKIKEAILAFRIERVVSKAHILELYLNEIYLGGGAYGVAAAALSYFDKSLDQLTIPEAAFLAALPKGPSNYNPVRFPDAARTRRDWVIQRMAEDGYITAADAATARKTPLVIVASRDPGVVDASYFGEEVRRDLVERFGEAKLYGGGLSVRTIRSTPSSRPPRIAPCGPASSPTTAVTAGAARSAGWPSRRRRRRPGSARWRNFRRRPGPAPGNLPSSSRSTRAARRSASARAGPAEFPSRSSPGRGRRWRTSGSATAPVVQRTSSGGATSSWSSWSARDRTASPTPRPAMRCARFPRSAAPSSPSIPIPAACSR
jgi:transglycosylase-like protein